MKPDRLLLFAGFASLLLCSALLLRNGWKEMNWNEKQFHTQQGQFVIHYDDSSSGQSESTRVMGNGEPVSNGATEERFSIKRTPDGFINTTATRINFQQENWFESFLEVQHFLENTPYSTKVDLDAINREQAVLYKDHAFLRDCCIRFPGFVLHLYEEKQGSMERRAITEFNMKDFYYNHIRSSSTPLKGTPLPADHHVLYLHPRQYSNVFHVLEGTTFILRLSLHPELFLPISTIVLADHPSFPPDSWSSLLEDLYLEIFPPSRRPTYAHKTPDSFSSLTCDPIMVVARAWETDGTGSFIGEPLAGDLLRAVAYKRIGWRFEPKKKGDELSGALIRRLGKRKLLNTNDVLRALQNGFNGVMKTEEWVLEKSSGETLIRQFSSLDVLVAAHGAGVTNIIFMVPNSAVYELFPPFWQYGCYRRLASNVGVLYAKDTAVGVKGRECDRDPNSLYCQYNGIRDRDFVMNVTVIERRMKKVVWEVWNKKYHVVL